LPALRFKAQQPYHPIQNKDQPNCKGVEMPVTANFGRQFHGRSRRKNLSSHSFAVRSVAYAENLK